MDILKKLLIVLLITFPLGVLIRIQVINQAYVYPLDVVLLVTVLYQVYMVVSKPKKLDNVSKAFLLFICFAFISLILNAFWLGLEHTIVASLYLLRFVMFASLVYIFRFVDEPFRKKYLYWMFISGFVVILLGFVQYIFYPNLRNLYYLGWDEHLYRMFSTFLDPNFAGAFFVLQSILTLFLLKNIKSGAKKYGLLILLIISLIAMFLSYSRTAYVMLIFSVPVILILLKKIKYLIVLLAFIIIGMILIPKNLHSEGVDLLRTASIISRVETYQEGFHVFSSSPIYGVGFNAYRYAKERQGITNKSLFENHAAAGISNSYLLVLTTTGVIGLLLFLNIFRIVVVLSWKDLTKDKYMLSFLVLTTTIAILVGSLFENIFFYESLMFWYFAILGIWNASKTSKD